MLWCDGVVRSCGVCVDSRGAVLSCRRAARTSAKPLCRQPAAGPAVVAVGAWREPQPPTARVPAARRSHGRIQRNRPTSDLGEAVDLASVPQSAALSSGPRRAPEPLRRSSCGLEGRRARIELRAAAICYRALRLCKLLSCRFLAACGGRPSVGATAKLASHIKITTLCFTAPKFLEGQAAPLIEARWIRGNSAPTRHSCQTERSGRRGSRQPSSQRCGGRRDRSRGENPLLSSVPVKCLPEAWKQGGQLLEYARSPPSKSADPRHGQILPQS